MKIQAINQQVYCKPPKRNIVRTQAPSNNVPTPINNPVAFKGDRGALVGMFSGALIGVGAAALVVATGGLAAAVAAVGATGVATAGAGAGAQIGGIVGGLIEEKMNKDDK